MGILSWLTGPSIPNPDLFASDTVAVASPWSDTSHLNTLTLQNLYGLDDTSSLPLSRAEAMTIPAVAKARNLIVSSISRLPLVAVRNGNTPAPRNHFFGQLSQGRTNQSVLAQVVDDLLFYGRSYVLVSSRTQDGLPQYVEWVERSRVDETDHGTKIDGSYVKRSDLIRFDGITEGLLHTGRDALRVLKQLEQAAGEAGYIVPPLVLKQKTGDDLLPHEIDELLAGWNRARRKKGGSVGFANSAIDVETLDTGKEALLIEALNWSVLQVARLVGLPARFLDGSVSGSALNYVNTSQQNQEILESLSPYMETITQTFSLFLPYGQTATFDVSELLQRDRKGRFEEYAVALQSGFMTVDEVRALEGMEPLNTSTTPPEVTE